jgi:hypothetical protein
VCESIRECAVGRRGVLKIMSDAVTILPQEDPSRVIWPYYASSGLLVCGCGAGMSLWVEVNFLRAGKRECKGIEKCEVRLVVQEDPI